MKKMMSILAATSLLIGMIASSAMAADLTKEDVAGSWYLVKIEAEGMSLSPADMGFEGVLDFKDDDTWELAMTGEDAEKGTYDVSGEAVIMHSDTTEDISLTMGEDGYLVGDEGGTIMSFGREKPEATDWSSIIGKPSEEEAALSDFAGVWEACAVEYDEMTMAANDCGLKATLQIAEDGTATLEMKDSLHDEEPLKTELKGTLEGQTLTLVNVDEDAFSFGVFLSPDKLTLNLQDTGTLRNIEYTMAEEGEEPEINNLVYFEKTTEAE